MKVVGKVSNTPSRDWFDWLVGAAFISAGFGSVATLIVISLQLRGAANSTRQQRAAEAAAVWNDRKFSEILSPVFGFVELQELQSVEDCIGKTKAWYRATYAELRCLPTDGISALAYPPPLASKNDVFYVLGILEDFALRYNENEVPRRWVALTLGPNLVRVLTESLWLIRLVRDQYNWPTMACELVAAVQDLRTTDWPIPSGSPEDPRAIWKPIWKRPGWDQFPHHPLFAALKAEPSQVKVRVICLPPVPDEASDEEWALAAQLSNALADEDRRNDFRSSTPRGASRSPGWSAVVVPTSIMFGSEEIKQDRRLTDELNRVLSPLTNEEVEKEINRLTPT